MSHEKINNIYKEKNNSLFRLTFAELWMYWCSFRIFWLPWCLLPTPPSSSLLYTGAWRPDSPVTISSQPPSADSPVTISSHLHPQASLVSAAHPQPLPLCDLQHRQAEVRVPLRPGVPPGRPPAGGVLSSLSGQDECRWGNWYYHFIHELHPRRAPPDRPPRPLSPLRRWARGPGGRPPPRQPPPRPLIPLPKLLPSQSETSCEE